MKHSRHSFLVLSVVAVLVTLGVRALVEQDGSYQAVSSGSSSSVRTAVRVQRRDYSRAMVLCRDLVDKGATIDCQGVLNINDPSSLVPFLQGTWSSSSSSEPAHPAAPEGLGTEDLDATDRALLRRYQRAGVCPESLRQYLPGFFDLCESVVRDMGARPRRVLQDRAAERYIPHMAVPEVHSLEDFIKVNRRSIPQ